MEVNNNVNKDVLLDENGITNWFKAVHVSAIPENAGACVRYQDKQIAIFYFARRNEWYACQNLCPHKAQMVLSRGMIGTAGEEPKVACPFHKRTFSLQSGACLNAAEADIEVFPVKVEEDYIYVGLK